MLVSPREFFKKIFLTEKQRLNFTFISTLQIEV